MEKKTNSLIEKTTDRKSDFTPKSAEKVLSGKNKHPLRKQDSDQRAGDH